MYFARRLYIFRQTYRCMTRFLLVISSAKGDVCTSAGFPGSCFTASTSRRLGDGALRDIHDTRGIVLLRQWPQIATGMPERQLRLQGILVSYFMQRLAARTYTFEKSILG